MVEILSSSYRFVNFGIEGKRWGGEGREGFLNWNKEEE